jgi:small subunit ribosomal protein S20
MEAAIRAGGNVGVTFFFSPMGWQGAGTIRFSACPDEDPMANTKSAKKAARQTLRKTEVNKSRRSRTRTAVKKVEEAIKAGKADEAIAALRGAEPEMMRAARAGVMHKNTASRKVSRLTKAIKAIKA